MQVLLTVLACLGCYSAMALECKFCIQYDGKSDNKDIQAGLDILKSVGNANCKDNPGDASITSTPCDPAAQGTKGVCSTTSIGATSEIPGTDLEMNFQLYMRLCQTVAASEESGCSSVDKYEKEIREGMGPNAGNLKGINGEMCVCEGDNCNTNMAKEPPQIAGSEEPQMAGSEEPQMAAGSEVTKPVVLYISLLLSLVYLLV